jgi:hypothetical protein
MTKQIEVETLREWLEAHEPVAVVDASSASWDSTRRATSQRAIRPIWKPVPIGAR